MLKHRIYSMIIALLAGITLCYAFAPYHHAVLAWICPAYILGCWLYATPKEAFWTGWLFGLGLFGRGLYWLFISIHDYGHVHTALALFITTALIACLALYPGSLGLVFVHAGKRCSITTRALLLFPILWITWEMLRTACIIGSPWLVLGYSQTDSPLAGFAPLMTVYGVSGLIIVLSGLFVIAFLPQSSWKKRGALLIAGCAILFTGHQLRAQDWTHPAAAPWSVTLVQGNVSQANKWDNQSLNNIVHRYAKATQQHWSSQLIVWPETAIPTSTTLAAPFLLHLTHLAQMHHSTIVSGIVHVNHNQQHYYNAIIMLGMGNGLYFKRRLLPFGEYVPLSSLFSGLMTHLHIPQSNLIPGSQHQPPLYIDQTPIAALICYEIAYPWLAIKSIFDKQLAIVVSDDSWFGHSIASAQQLQIAQMRAIETGRPILYSTNTGITAIINARGKITHQLKPNTFATLTGKITPRVGYTPFTYLLSRWFN